MVGNENPQGGHVDVYKMSGEIDRLRVVVATLEADVTTLRTDLNTLGDRYNLLQTQLSDALHSSSIVYNRPTEMEREIVDRLTKLEAWRAGDNGVT